MKDWSMQQIIEHFCCREDLSTSDPYDVWKTPIGFRVKSLFNRDRFKALPLAGLLAVTDNFLNNEYRFCYTAQEYPIVRAYAALCLLNLYKKKSDRRYIAFAKKHLLWLSENSCTGYSGLCWGLAFDYAVGRDFSYSRNMPLATMTPYPLEAMITYRSVTGSNDFDQAISGIYRFFENDIVIIEETDEHLVTSYAAMKDRIVVNAVTYAMYAYALLLPFTPLGDHERIREKIRKMYSFVKKNQAADGSWLYSPEGKSFIDCFHSCIVLKNILKTDRIVSLEGATDVAGKGYSFLKEQTYDAKEKLFRRFALSNKPSLVRFDLYDNAEMLNLAIMLNDRDLVFELHQSVQGHFVKECDTYSQIDCLGIRRNRNTLRWAVMPYLFALSQMQEQ